ncbi:MAG: PQQ-binding-like beta-propeller repeat protein, partial [Planctomycetaceae bacterium]|nr:PQQ-binding-like beta-propeller repeat protein [Planctomycetaceae bacterium]
LENLFGAGSSPLIDGGKVIATVGGRTQKAGVVAFELATGHVLWKAVADGSSYSSPVMATIGGKQRVIALTRLKCVVLDPHNGDVLAEFPYGLRGPTVTAANPIVIRDQLFLSASYGIGARLVNLAGAQPEELWDGNDLMSSQYTTCIEHDGLLYGVDGRQDIPPATLKCFDPVTQKVIWSEEDFGYATLIKADGKLLIMTTDGELVLAALGGDTFQPLKRTRLFNDTVRALPALSNGKLYVRDTGTLKCVNLGE